MNKRNAKSKRVIDAKPGNAITRIILMTIIIISLGILIGVISYTLYTVKDYNDKTITYNILNTSVEVVNYNIMGLNGDKDAVRFGKITAGNRGVRYLNISTKEKAIVSIYVSGDMAKFISVDKNNFLVEENFNQLVPIKLKIPSDTPSGNYTGEIYVKLSRP